jgi:threonine dehydratase
MGLVVEPAGVVGIAAMLSEPSRFAGSFVGTPLCGGNVTAEQRAAWL